MIAEKIGVTSGYLQRLFRETCNTSVIEYLLRYRMENACKMLMETEMSIQEVSVEIGYSDVKNFYYRFKKIFGVTPTQYRLNHKKEES
jgi:two-component system response regulator YesN